MWEIAAHLAVACDVCDCVFMCCLFFPRCVLDEIFNIIEQVSGGGGGFLSALLFKEGDSFGFHQSSM